VEYVNGANVQQYFCQKLLEYSCELALGYARMMGWLMPRKDHDSQMRDVEKALIH
jgi:hypothetical protein